MNWGCQDKPRTRRKKKEKRTPTKSIAGSSPANYVEVPANCRPIAGVQWFWMAGQRVSVMLLDEAPGAVYQDIVPIGLPARGLPLLDAGVVARDRPSHLESAIS